MRFWAHFEVVWVQIKPIKVLFLLYRMRLHPLVLQAGSPSTVQHGAA